MITSDPQCGTFSRELEALHPDNSESIREQAARSTTVELFGKRQKGFDRR
jgi:hypothetical protein